ncbi:MAG: FKBP-type peptidyl-prolyl cis-trans isomerase [Planctomycetota bacterium]|nr:FKBP-type peptidyl-prolyl cis-trans isomerase [Planctomycetota bacterium]
MVVGTGAEARLGDVITAHYTLWLKDGTKVQSSLETGTPFTKPLARGEVIEGWLYGIPGMKAGGKRRLEIPSHMAYGNQRVGGVIPPNSDLVFEVQLLAVRRR